ncbi:MAG: helical backbone metal receptor [Planctomycetota bacterium]
MAMNRKFLLVGMAAGAIVITAVGRHFVPAPAGPAPRAGAPARIVSLSPSLTETLFALGLADRVAGVTRFCAHIPGAKGKPTVGGFLDLNLESVMNLRPDLVVTLPWHREVKDRLAGMGLATLEVNHDSVAGIRASLVALGKACGVEGRTREILADLDRRAAALAARTAGRSRPRVLVTTGRPVGTGTLQDICIAGRGSVFDDLITLAGGDNAWGDRKLPYPTLSAEGVLTLAPEVIMDLVPDLEKNRWSAAMILREWSVLPDLPAVKTGRIHVFGEPWALAPGPRYVELAEKMADVIHPRK